MTIQAVMFQRLSNLLFGEVEEVAVELKGPNPCVTEADEEGWMIVNLSGKSQLRKDTSVWHFRATSNLVIFKRVLCAKDLGS